MNMNDLKNHTIQLHQLVVYWFIITYCYFRTVLCYVHLLMQPTFNHIPAKCTF